MSLHPHLHLLIPISDPNIHLEIRLYLPVDPPSPSSSSLPLTTLTSSSAISTSQLDPTVIRTLRQWGVERLITASHQWAKMNATMLTQVIANHLVSVAVDGARDKRTAVLSYNVRGVGLSMGKQPWHGLGIRMEAEDFAAVERWGLESLAPKELVRFGCSWGTIAVINAPPPSTHPLTSILVVCPTLSLFWIGSFFDARLFHRGFRALLEGSRSLNSAGKSDTGKKTKVWMIYGTEDGFTSVQAYRALAGELKEAGLEVGEVEGGGHFFTTEPEGERLEQAFGEWLDAI